jgi:hypothetical protein
MESGHSEFMLAKAMSFNLLLQAARFRCLEVKRFNEALFFVLSFIRGQQKRTSDCSKASQ